MPFSRFNQIMTGIAIPALLDAFAIPVIHTNSADVEAAITAIIEQAAVAVGDYGERVENRWTATLPVAAGAVVGDTLTVAADNPADDDMIWQLTQVLDHDGYLQRFALRIAPPPPVMP